MHRSAPAGIADAAAFENSVEALKSRLQDLQVSVACHGRSDAAHGSPSSCLHPLLLQGDVLGTVRGHFDQFSKAFLCVNHLQSKVASVTEHLNELRAAVSVDGIAGKTIEAATRVAALRHQLAAHETMLTCLRILSEVRA